MTHKKIGEDKTYDSPKRHKHIRYFVKNYNACLDQFGEQQDVCDFGKIKFLRVLMIKQGFKKSVRCDFSGHC